MVGVEGKKASLLIWPFDLLELTVFQGNDIIESPSFQEDDSKRRNMVF